MTKKGSKNNISNRGKKAALRSYNGIEVKPVMYYSNGRKMIVAQNAADGKLVLNNSGAPLPYKEADASVN